MKQIVFFLVILIAFSGCKPEKEPFAYELRGTVTGIQNGALVFMKTNRLGDEVQIPIIDHQFEYKGVSTNMFFTGLEIESQEGAFFPLAIEPGEIILELNSEDLYWGSVVFAGAYNLEMIKAIREMADIFDDESLSDDELDANLLNWVKRNQHNYAGIYYLNTWMQRRDMMPINDLKSFLYGIKDPNILHSRDYIQLYSIFKAKKDHKNATGEPAISFALPDENGVLVKYPDVSEGRMTFVEKSGSWCINSTHNSRSLLPVYEQYHHYGFEIITVVYESDHERWRNWIGKEEFPWITLLELEDDVTQRGLSYGKMLFQNGNYLVDLQGVVISNDLSAAELNEILMQQFEPDKYVAYQDKKWEMPANVHILDRSEPLQSFVELTEYMRGRAFLIDCWASWCSPCFDEFQYNDQLKAFLRSNGVEMVYINFDRRIDESNWIRLIRENNLQGYHMRVNDSFVEDLYEQGFSGSLPAYMIVNKKGMMVEADAFRPSQAEKLYNQISRALLPI